MLGGSFSPTCSWYQLLDIQQGNTQSMFLVENSLLELRQHFGATLRQATLQQVKRSLEIAPSPVLDSAKTVGLISLGEMTGLVMGGASPLKAVQLQIVIMNMMIGSATVSSYSINS